jgi:hypothetical protein
MAPIKFEENIKDKLEQRALKPSPDAWQKLSDRLDAEPKEKKYKTYWWLSIAASFAGLLIMSSILFSKGPEAHINTPVIVEEETKNPVKEKGFITQEIVEGQKIQENQLVIEEEVKRDNKKQNKSIVKLNKLIVNNESEGIVSVEENKIQEKVNQKVNEVVVYHEIQKVAAIESLKSAEAKKIDEVVAQIQKLQKEKSSVTDAEIDALLNQAQEELITERLYNESTKTVDAELLLLEVETDLDQSFRDRVFDALKSGYKKVKTAVAERNN